MKTHNYNPSPLEIEMAEILASMQDEINSRLTHSDIVDIRKELHNDNPLLIIRTKDKENDSHILTIKFMQKPDDDVKD
jgi:hypothetical protein